jgi:hypothetical protein
MKRAFVFSVIVLFLLPISAKSADWSKSYRADGARFIPVELWTGSDWNGEKSLTLPPTDLTFGKRGHKRIIGPRKWTHPSSGTVHQIYERRNRDKVQYFAVNRKGDGLGRVYDSRYGRYCPDEVKFPLGWWKLGEKRVYDITCDRRKRHIEVTITKLNFTYDGTPDSLEFHWKLDDGTKRGSNNHYTYSPGKGLVEVSSN